MQLRAYSIINKQNKNKHKMFPKIHQGLYCFNVSYCVCIMCVSGGVHTKRGGHRAIFGSQYYPSTVCSGTDSRSSGLHSKHICP